MNLPRFPETCVITCMKAVNMQHMEIHSFFSVTKQIKTWNTSRTCWKSNLNWMGTCPEEVLVTLTKSHPIILLCVWGPFIDWRDVPMKLGGIWHLSNWIMPWKAGDSDVVFMMIPLSNHCAYLGGGRLDWVWRYVRFNWMVRISLNKGKECANHVFDPKDFWKSYEYLYDLDVRSGKFRLWHFGAGSSLIMLITGWSWLMDCGSQSQYVFLLLCFRWYMDQGELAALVNIWHILSQAPRGMAIHVCCS